MKHFLREGAIGLKFEILVKRSTSNTYDVNFIQCTSSYFVHIGLSFFPRLNQYSDMYKVRTRILSKIVKLKLQYLEQIREGASGQAQNFA